MFSSSRSAPGSVVKLLHPVAIRLLVKQAHSPWCVYRSPKLTAMHHVRMIAVDVVLVTFLQSGGMKRNALVLTRTTDMTVRECGVRWTALGTAHVTTTTGSAPVTTASRGPVVTWSCAQMGVQVRVSATARVACAHATMDEMD